MVIIAVVAEYLKYLKYYNYRNLEIMTGPMATFKMIDYSIDDFEFAINLLQLQVIDSHSSYYFEDAVRLVEIKSTCLGQMKSFIGDSKPATKLILGK